MDTVPRIGRRQRLHQKLEHVGQRLKGKVHQTAVPSADRDLDPDNGEDSHLWHSWDVLPRLLRKGLSDSQRLTKLQALGSCKDVKVADTFQMYTHGEDCNLSLAEWGALLVPLKSNPSLEEIHIWLPHGQPPESWRIIGQYWEEVVENASALKKLSVSVYGPRSCKDILFPVDNDSKTHASIGFRLPVVLEHLASGLKANPNPALEQLYVEFGESPSSDTVRHVVEMLGCPLKKLRKLSLVDVPRLEESDVQALSNALKKCTSLCILEIKGAKEGMTEVLRQTYRESGSSQILLEKLILRGPCIAGLGPALPHLLAANVNHLLLDFSDLDLVWRPGPGPTPPNAYESVIRRDGKGFPVLVNFPWVEIGSALLRTECLVLTFTILLECRDRVLLRAQMETCMEGLQEVWEASRQSPLFCISLNWDVLDFHKYQNYADVLSYVDVLKRALSLVGLKNVRVVLNVTNSDDTEALVRAAKSVIDTLNKNTHIARCSLGFSQLAGGISEMKIAQIRSLLVHNLRHNTSIQQLILESSFFQGLTEQVFREDMELLTENFALQQIDVKCEEWKRDGKAALVQKAVNRDARNAEYISVIRNAELKVGTITAGRILLCGATSAGKKDLPLPNGKSSLMKTMLHTIKSGRVSSALRSTLAKELRGKEPALRPLKMTRTCTYLSGTSADERSSALLRNCCSQKLVRRASFSLSSILLRWPPNYWRARLRRS